MNLEQKKIKSLKSANKAIKKKLEQVGIVTHHENPSYIKWNEKETKSFDFHEVKLEQLVEFYKKEETKEWSELIEIYAWVKTMNQMLADEEEPEYQIVFEEKNKEVEVYEVINVYPAVGIKNEERKKQIEKHIRLKGYEAELKSVELKSTFNKEQGLNELYNLIDQINDELSETVSKVNADLRNKILAMMEKEEKMYINS